MRKQRKPNTRGFARTSAFSLVAVIAVGIAGCGSESTAADAAAGASSGQAAALNAQAATAPVSAATATVASLPIEQGIYGYVEDGGCARTTLAFFYDGANYGRVSQEEGEAASVNVYRIQRAGSFTPADIPPSANIRDFQGFTKISSTELGKPDKYNEIEIEFVGIKALGAGRFIERTGGTAIGIGRSVQSDNTYQKCAFSQLSPQMQAAIRAKRPQLAGAATPPQPSATAPIKFPPLPKGYYAVGTTCARAASAQAASDGPGNLVRFDESALTWFDGGPEIRGFESLGADRFRVRARSHGNGDDAKGAGADFVIRITGASSFVTEPGSALFDKQESYTHCPTNMVPKAVRDWFEG